MPPVITPALEAQAKERLSQPNYQPAFTPEGNAELRQRIPDAAERDRLAVAELQAHARQSGDVNREYSASEVHQELASRGLLPSQLDARTGPSAERPMSAPKSQVSQPAPSVQVPSPSPKAGNEATQSGAKTPLPRPSEALEYPQEEQQ